MEDHDAGQTVDTSGGRTSDGSFVDISAASDRGEREDVEGKNSAKRVKFCYFLWFISRAAVVTFVTMTDEVGRCLFAPGPRRGPRTRSMHCLTPKTKTKGTVDYQV